jgi:acetylglutamate kinase
MIVVRIDESTLGSDSTTLYADLAFLVERGQHPIVIAPSADAARAIVKAINRTSDAAVGVSGADAGMLPAAGEGLGAVQTRLLHTLLAAGYIPVVEPLAFGFSGGDVAVLADDVASAVARSMAARRALFFHENGGVIDASTHECIGQLTPAEALTLADDGTLPHDLRAAVRAAALGVRGGVGAADILDGRIAHATIVELLTARHVGTRVIGTVFVPAA